MGKSLKNTGLFITLEGTEGAGKSTLIRLLTSALKDQGHDVLCTREPGGTPLAEQMRALILAHPMHPLSETFLYQAARTEHVESIIRPALERGAIVLCDRFTDSTLAYQGGARGLPMRDLQILNRMATQGLTPDLTLWLDIDVETGLKRAKDANRFEAEGLAFQQKVRSGFLLLSKKEPRRFVRIAVTKMTPEQICTKALALIEAKRGGA